MKKIILSADSTCDLGATLKKQYDVHYFPYHIFLEGVDYQDNVSITVDKIFQAYYDRQALPQTAAINVSEYVDYFRDWVTAGYDVIHLNLGSAVSSSHNNCKLAARELNSMDKGGRVYPIDSCNLSTGIALQIIETGDLIAQGVCSTDIVEYIKTDVVPRCHSSFMLDTLDFMKAGGRCSTVAAFGANLLGLKPCIEVDNKNGSMSSGKKYRGNLEKVLVQYTNERLAMYPNIKKDHLFITYSTIDEKYLNLVEDTIRQVVDIKHIHRARTSCTIACHCGPNTLGLLFKSERNS